MAIPLQVPVAPRVQIQLHFQEHPGHPQCWREAAYDAEEPEGNVFRFLAGLLNAGAGVVKRHLLAVVFVVTMGLGDVPQVG